MYLYTTLYKAVIKPHVMSVIHHLDSCFIIFAGECSTCSINPLATVNHNTPVWKEDELTFGWGERPIQISGQADIYYTRAATLETLHLQNRVKDILDFCVIWLNTSIKRKTWQIYSWVSYWELDEKTGTTLSNDICCYRQQSANLAQRKDARAWVEQCI